VLGGIFYFVRQNNEQYTEQTINSYLELGARAFDATQAEQSQTLLAIVSSLTLDFGFRAAFGTRDPATFFDAALNVLDRSLGSVDMLLITDLDGEIIIDTNLLGMTRLEGQWRALVDAADRSEDGLAETVIVIEGEPFEVMAVPLYLPRQVAWILGGYRIDGPFLETVKDVTLSDVSLLRVAPEQPPRVIASTLAPENWTLLAQQVDLSMVNSAQPQRIVLATEEYGTLPRRLTGTADTEQLVALIQRSYGENRENQQRFQGLLVQFYILILLASCIAVVLLSRSIANPLTRLAAVVRQIEKGDYSREVRIKARDELGQLADSVNSMARGLAEKEKVRDLLGKVVSRQIAEELLRNPVELGGEERVVTMMFVDIKGFTAFCEGRPPAQVLAILNRYLSHITDIVEANKGVVDKFNGDAVMALFGAPVAHLEDTANGVGAALEILSTIGALGPPDGPADLQLEACIGLHTGLVVAGNLGSLSRLNYSVIGDSVNLASRLESLTRLYGLSCIVSEETVRDAADFLYRELDLVQVFGRQEPVRIYELIGRQGAVADEVRAEVLAFGDFLQSYRDRQWTAALAILDHWSPLTRRRGLYAMYRDRIVQWQTDPPPADWQGVHTFDRK
jgi:adenylate cyclase